MNLAAIAAYDTTVSSPKCAKVARIDGRDRQHDQHVDGVELAVDDGALADVAAKAEIAL